MEVRIVTFPETRVVTVTHRGAPSAEYDTVRRLVAWKLAQNLRDPSRYRHYGLHYTNPHAVAPEDHRVVFCLSVDDAVALDDGMRHAVIPAQRCALARDIGSRTDNRAARHLYRHWLPASGEVMADAPLIFHYVNVGPEIRTEDAVTDVYLPLR